MEIPDPQMVDFPDWAGVMATIYSGDELSNFPYLPWQQWALQLYTRPSFADVSVPDPMTFTDWRDWATALRDTAG